MSSESYLTEEERERLERARSTVAELEWKPTPLWRLFREASCEGGECRDIVEKHVLPKLSTTHDVKFFYDVNTETRALIRRASRTDELGKRFIKVREMTSISTLEFAWKNRSFWPDYWDEIRFCWKVAETNKLELLKWIREVKKCKWDKETINMAARQGNLEMIKYCVASECPMDAWTCAYAAGNGHLECLKYLHEEAEAEWNISAVVSQAALYGHLHILEYVVERKYDQFSVFACAYAAWNGHLDCLKYLHEVAKAPWNYRAVEETHGRGRLKCLQYLLDNGCPLPDGWEYENGTLHVPQQDA